MCKLSDDDNKKKINKDTQVTIGKEIVTNQVIQQKTAQADAAFSKPKYNPQTRKEYYDGPSHKAAKDNAFSQGGVVKDPYTGSELVPTIKEAKMKFGNNWQEHLAEADHIVPLNKIAKGSEKNPWITTEDIKNVGNNQDNFQVISRRTNQTGGKGGSTQTEWSQDHEKMQRISEQTGEPVESIAKRVSQVGKKAEKTTNAKFALNSIKNVAVTAHDAGKTGAVYAGGTVVTISGIYNIASCVKGEKTVPEALEDIGEDGAKAFVYGYAKSAALTVVNHTLTSSNSELLVALGKNNAAGKLVTTITVVGGTVVKWGSGEITTGECLIELGDKGMSFAGACYGAALGQVIIPIPVVGAAVGSLIGGTLTSEVYNGVMQGIQSTSEEKRRKLQEIYEAEMRIYNEQKRRKEVQQLIKTNTERAVINSVKSIILGGELQNLMAEAAAYFENHAEIERRIAECVLVTLQLQEYRRQLQEYIDTYFMGCEYCFASALDLMDSSLKMGDYDGAIAGTNQVTKLFGKKPVIENTQDFKKKIFGNDNISF